MTTDVRDFKNRRSAVDLLRKLGIAPYHYDDLIQLAGDRYQVVLRDGQPIAKILLLAEAMKTGAALARPEETPQARAQRVKQVDVLGNRYARTEAAAIAEEEAARAPKPRKRRAKRARAKKPKAKKLRGVRQPRPPVLDTAAVAEAAKALKATTVGAACLELYRAGRRTAEVWLIVKKKFKLDETKVTYPSWYLCHYRRRGLLPAGKREARA